MHVDNIFELINKFSNEEDQVSAAYGFILKDNVKILQKFLNKIIKIDLKPEKKGGGTKAQVNFSTKLSELLCAKSVGKIKTLKKLKAV